MAVETGDLFEALVDHLTANGGRLVITVDEEDSPRVTVGYHFGEEESGSELAAGAAYANEATVHVGLRTVLHQLGVKVSEPASADDRLVVDRLVTRRMADGIERVAASLEAIVGYIDVEMEEGEAETFEDVQLPETEWQGVAPTDVPGAFKLGKVQR